MTEGGRGGEGKEEEGERKAAECRDSRRDKYATFEAIIFAALPLVAP